MKIILKTKTIIILLISVLAVGDVVVFTVFLSLDKKLFSPETEKGIIQDQRCVFNIEERIVRGNSLSGVLEPGETVKVLFGYYGCNEVKREDVVVYSYAGNSEPLIKIIKGIPGDKFAFQNIDQNIESGWQILINEEILKNSKNQPYLLDGRGYRMLSLYEKDYGGVIPEDAYLIMGNLTSGARDSSRYGMVHKNDILGKPER